MRDWKKLLDLDRRVIYIFMALAVIVPPLIPGFRPTITITDAVRRIYNKIDDMPRGSKIFMSLDYDPTSAPELTPMSLAVLHHCFSKGHKVIVMTLWPTGIDLIEETLLDASKVVDKDGNEKIIAEEYKDWVFLVNRPGGIIVINAVCSENELKKTFNKDHRKKPTRDLEILRGINSLRDIDFMVQISAGTPGLDQWIIFGKEKANFEMAGGCTGVMATQYFPYLQSKQLVGLMPGLKGAAEYEALIGRKAAATRRMASQTIAHIVIIMFILIGNAAFFLSRKRKEED